VSDIEEAVTPVHHEEPVRVLTALTRRFGDPDVAAEAAAQVFATASRAAGFASLECWRTFKVSPAGLPSGSRTGSSRNVPSQRTVTNWRQTRASCAGRAAAGRYTGPDRSQAAAVDTVAT
jgi:hypothetical protein